MFAPYAIINFMIEKLFYANRADFPISKTAIEKILSESYGIDSPVLSYTKNGKPFLPGGEIHFSVTHTDEMLFLAFSNEKIGIDAEKITRKVDCAPILKRLHPTICKKIDTNEDFLQIWTVLESAIKYLGGTLACDLKKFSFHNNRLLYDNEPFPVHVYTQVFQNHFVSVCANSFESTCFTSIL